MLVRRVASGQSVVLSQSSVSTAIPTIAGTQFQGSADEMDQLVNQIRQQATPSPQAPQQQRSSMIAIAVVLFLAAMGAVLFLLLMAG